jgi:hypothetical protein
MELTSWVVLVPLSLGSLATGLICSLGSAWGLFRHYWVLFKLLINLVATIGDAVVYDTFSRLLLGPFRERIAADVAAVAPDGARVLDVGCGPATCQSSWLANTGWR